MTPLQNEKRHNVAMAMYVQIKKNRALMFRCTACRNDFQKSTVYTNKSKLEPSGCNTTFLVRSVCRSTINLINQQLGKNIKMIHLKNKEKRKSGESENGQSETLSKVDDARSVPIEWTLSTVIYSDLTAWIGKPLYSGSQFESIYL